MENIIDSQRISTLYLGKKIKNKKKIFKIKKYEKSQKDITKTSNIFELSTDLSSSNILNLEEKSDTIIKYPSLEDVVIPPFLNDITKYNDINRKIKNYYKIEKELGSPELAKLYLIDVKRLYEEKKKI